MRRGCIGKKKQKAKKENISTPKGNWEGLADGGNIASHSFDFFSFFFCTSSFSEATYLPTADDERKWGRTPGTRPKMPPHAGEHKNKDGKVYATPRRPPSFRSSRNANTKSHPPKVNFQGKRKENSLTLQWSSQQTNCCSTTKMIFVGPNLMEPFIIGNRHCVWCWRVIRMGTLEKAGSDFHFFCFIFHSSSSMFRFQWKWTMRTKARKSKCTPPAERMCARKT